MEIIVAAMALGTLASLALLLVVLAVDAIQERHALR